MEKMPIAIDPYYCGCTECCTGEYIPAERATREQKLAVIKGELRNNSCDPVELAIRFYEGDLITEINFLGETFEIMNPQSSITILGCYQNKITDLVNFDVVELS